MFGVAIEFQITDNVMVRCSVALKLMTFSFYHRGIVATFCDLDMRNV